MTNRRDFVKGVAAAIAMPGITLSAWQPAGAEPPGVDLDTTTIDFRGSRHSLVINRGPRRIKLLGVDQERSYYTVSVIADVGAAARWEWPSCVRWPVVHGDDGIAHIAPPTLTTMVGFHDMVTFLRWQGAIYGTYVLGYR